MAGAAFTEEIKFYTQTLTSDDQGGKTPSGETLSLTTLAVVSEKPLTRTNSDGQLTFNKALSVSTWKNPAFIPTETTIVEWRGKRYAIQNLAEDDMHIKLLFNLVART